MRKMLGVPVLIALALTSCSGGGDSFTLDERRTFLDGQDLNMSVTDFDGYTEEEYRKEEEGWCKSARWNTENEYMVEDGPQDFWFTVRLSCGKDRADEVIASAGPTDGQLEAWAREFDDELKRLGLS